MKIDKINSLSKWPFFEEDEVDAARSVLVSGKVNYWTGQEGKTFEKEFADYIGCSHAIVLANGTLTLELALYTLDIGPGDEVIVPSCTFIATASAVVARGAKPVCADILPYQLTIDPDSIKDLITPQTKAIICVHLGGYACDMDRIMEIAAANNLSVIEDCAQSHGASVNGKKLGSFGDFASFSFCQDKIMTTGGEGGILLCNDEALWKKAWEYKDHGKSYDTTFNREHPTGFRWLHESFGTNWRLTEMQSAIGRRQLSKLDSWIDARNRNAEILISYIKDIPAIELQTEHPDMRNAYYKFYCFLNLDLLADGWNKLKISDALFELGVPCFAGSCTEIYKEKAFEVFPDVYNRVLPNAADMWMKSLMFVVHHTLEESEVHEMGSRVHYILKQASK